MKQQRNHGGSGRGMTAAMAMAAALVAAGWAITGGGTLAVAAEPKAAAGAERPVPKPRPASAELERMKSMVGRWTGKADLGQGPIDMTMEYRVLAGGTVVEEKVFVGTPNEMTTMYYDRDGRLALTHYCVLGNRPGMVLGSSDAKTLKFNFDKSCGINPRKESHMHALTLRFDDADTVTMSCKAFMDGKEVPEHATTLKRVKN